jgi:hypothetical protein
MRRGERGEQVQGFPVHFFLLFFVLSTNHMFSLLRILTTCHHPPPLTPPTAALEPSWAQMTTDVVGAQVMFFNAFFFFFFSTNLFFPSLGSIYVLTMRRQWDTTCFTPAPPHHREQLLAGWEWVPPQNGETAMPPPSQTERQRNDRTAGDEGTRGQGGSNEEAHEKKGLRDVKQRLLGRW